MKKLLTFSIGLCAFIVALACGAHSPEVDATTGATDPSGDSGSGTAKGKMLLVYFSRAGENWQVGVVERGNTAVMADYIAELADVDVFEIEPETPYPSSYNEMLDLATQEVNSNARPKYKGDVKNLADYATVFVGGPIWWGRPPMIFRTFFEAHPELDGKTIIPFGTHGGSGIGSYTTLIQSYYPNATVLEPLGIDGASIRNEASKQTVAAWLARLGIEKKADGDVAQVFFTSDISAESLVKIYEQLGVSTDGKRVAVKISTGESARSNHLRPALIKDLVQRVGGTLVECNTAYGGSRSTTARHRQAIAERGYNDIANVDIMDEEGSINLPVTDTKWIKHDIVGSHLTNDDVMINLAHFKGHAMGGFGGVLKNQSIGVASASGKAYIHSAGKSTTNPWGNNDQDSFLESMAAAAQAVHDYFKQDGKDIVYINVMNNISIDCDCDGSPSTPQLKDIGILASRDPVALDKACLDLVFNHQSVAGDNASPLIRRIESLHGTHTVEYAEQLGLGTQQYNLVDIGQATAVSHPTASDKVRYNVYSLDGKKLRTNAQSLDGLKKGTYIVNGEKKTIE